MDASSEKRVIWKWIRSSTRKKGVGQTQRVQRSSAHIDYSLPLSNISVTIPVAMTFGLVKKSYLYYLLSAYLRS